MKIGPLDIRDCFAAACITKAIICYVFGIACYFFPIWLINFLFDTSELEFSGIERIMTLFVGNYVTHFGTCLILIGLFVNGETTRKKISLVLAITQLMGFIVCLSLIPGLKLSPLKHIKYQAFVLPVGYFFLVLMFLGVYFCKCKNCKTCKEKEK